MVDNDSLNDIHHLDVRFDGSDQLIDIHSTFRSLDVSVACTLILSRKQPFVSYFTSRRGPLIESTDYVDCYDVITTGVTRLSLRYINYPILKQVILVLHSISNHMQNNETLPSIITISFFSADGVQIGHSSTISTRLLSNRNILCFRVEIVLCSHIA